MFEIFLLTLRLSPLSLGEKLQNREKRLFDIGSTSPFTTPPLGEIKKRKEKEIPHFQYPHVESPNPHRHHTLSENHTHCQLPKPFKYFPPNQIKTNKMLICGFHFDPALAEPFFLKARKRACGKISSLWTYTRRSVTTRGNFYQARLMLPLLALC